MTMTRYPDRSSRRSALAPGILIAIALLAGLALLGNPSAFLIIRYAVSILALIVAVFAYQARQWWWLPVFVAIAVVWNPVFPFPFSGVGWLLAQYPAAIVSVVAGVRIRVPEQDARRPR